MTRRPPRGERVHLRLLAARDRDAFLDGVRRSRRLHHPWSALPDTPEAYTTYARRAADRRTFGVFRNVDDALAGVVNLSQIVRGPFASGFLGYFAFRPHAGKGNMREAIGLLARHAFDDLGLHRINANVQPANTRSTELMRACGFRLEGDSPRYLHIDGAWRDHRSWVLLADGPPEDEVLARSGAVTLHRVTSATWRDVVEVRARRDQSRFVADVTRYLTLCRYGGVWSPLAIRAGERTVGFVMWGRDADDGSYWIGGFVIDRTQQRKGYGRAALEALVAFLRTMPGCREIALSYEPANEVAAALYAEAGFVATDETVGDELVARMAVPGRRRS